MLWSPFNGQYVVSYVSVTRIRTIGQLEVMSYFKSNMTFCILVTSLIVSTLSDIHKHPKRFNAVATSMNILIDPQTIFV
jgi:hypothetical protein